MNDGQRKANKCYKYAGISSSASDTHSTELIGRPVVVASVDSACDRILHAPAFKFGYAHAHVSRRLSEHNQS